MRLQVNNTSENGSKQGSYSTWRDLAQNIVKSGKLGVQYIEMSNFDKIWRTIESSVNSAKNTEEKYGRCIVSSIKT